jgi:hypothetical protein
MPPDKQGGPEGPPRSAAAKQANRKIIIVCRRPERDRVQGIDRHCRIARMADQLMPMAVYYGPRPLLAVPIGHYYARGRWAA